MIFLSVFVHAKVVGQCFVALFLGGYFVFGSDSKSCKKPSVCQFSFACQEGKSQTNHLAMCGTKGPRKAVTSSVKYMSVYRVI